eukprot:9468381-Pyramimonas_sp.AAC.1
MGSEDRAASPIHRTCFVDRDAKQTGLHIEPHRRCTGDAARSFGSPPAPSPHLGVLQDSAPSEPCPA